MGIKRSGTSDSGTDVSMFLWPSDRGTRVTDLRLEQLSPHEWAPVAGGNPEYAWLTGFARKGSEAGGPVGPFADDDETALAGGGRAFDLFPAPFVSFFDAAPFAAFPTALSSRCKGARRFWSTGPATRGLFEKRSLSESSSVK